MKLPQLFDKQSWKTRKEWWNGTKTNFGFFSAISNIFPILFWFRHPITAWKQRNSYLDINL